jgi:hypothetical protein
VSLETDVQFTGRVAGESGLTTDADGSPVQQDISGGVEQDVGNVDSATLFLDVAGAVDVNVEFSPDGGTNWYEPAAESPVEFSESDTDLVHISYNVDRIRVSGSNSTAVKAQLREVV